MHRRKDEALINATGNMLNTILGFAFRSDLVGLGAITLLSLHMGTLGGRRRRAWLACVALSVYLAARSYEDKADITTGALARIKE